MRRFLLVKVLKIILPTYNSRKRGHVGNLLHGRNEAPVSALRPRLVQLVKHQICRTAKQIQM